MPNTDEGLVKIKRALITVTNKDGLPEFARRLERHEVQMISSGGTARELVNSAVSVTTVEAYTGQPEILDGRIKTIVPQVTGGILAIPTKPKHIEELAAIGAQPIQMVDCSLYNFPDPKTIADQGLSVDEVIEKIDIGGPTDIRAAIKNFRHVAVVTHPDQYTDVAMWMDAQDGCLTYKQRLVLAKLAIRVTRDFDIAVAEYMDSL